MTRYQLIIILLTICSGKMLAAIQIHPESGARDRDIRLVEHAVKEVEETAEKLFGKQYHLLSERVECKVFVYGAANEKANTDTATLESSGSGKHLSGNLHILANSEYEKGSKSMGGQNKDSYEYTLRLLGHEILSLYLEALSRTRSKGWSYYSAPDWFTQGSQEYAASLCVEQASRNMISDTYFRISNVEMAPAISVSNPYSGGFVIMQFIAETFGEGKILQIITSEAVTFDQALEDSIGGRDDLSAAFSKWKEKKTKR